MMSAQADLSTLLFMMFIHMSDADQDMTPYEVQSFNGLLEDQRWTRSARLREAVEALRKNYSVLWEAYDAGRLTIGIEDIAQALDAMPATLPADEADALHGGLDAFFRRLTRPGTSSFSRPGLTSVSPGRLRARNEIEALLAPRSLDGRDGDRGDDTRSVAANEPVRLRPAIAARGSSRAPLPLAEDSIRAEAPQATASGAWPDPGLAHERPNAWSGGRVRVRCVKILPETADVKTYIFAPVDGGLFRYNPGQFVTLELPVESRILRRSYTISSSPSRPFTLAITVKRAPLGWVSNWLYDNMVVGFEFEVSGPHGMFSCLHHPADKLLLISAGSGITPMMSMLRFLSDTASAADITFINHVRTPADIIFERELLQISAEHAPVLKLRVVPTRLPPGQCWHGVSGGIDDALLRALAPDLAKRETFVCGPPGYMAVVREMMERLGHPPERFHQESFGGGGVTPLPETPSGPMSGGSRSDPIGGGSTACATTESRASAPADAATAPQPRHHVARPSGALAAHEPPQAKIVFSRSRKTVTGCAGETVLELATRNGIALASSCRNGVCGTCRIVRLEGEVVMDGQRVLSEDEIECGVILACVARVRGRVVIDA